MSGAWLPWLWEVSRAILHQGPHCPFLVETEGNQTWGFFYMLASTVRAGARTRSGATQDGNPTPQVPRCINPREPAALSLKNRTHPSI